jgi:tetratricopeptide (TPR) repeat protein
MKKVAFLALVLLSVHLLFAQQRYALVIGNTNYIGVTSLINPKNDADDMEAALQSLGFNVEKLLDGSIEQMENAVLALRRKLRETPDSYGFFFYAGHGVQATGENYLIPKDASNILEESHLRQRAVSLQFIINNLKDAGNELNIIVLDACRDNPFRWARSGSNGLAGLIDGAPIGSIVMYATSINSVASDGIGRQNGLFTGYLLKNLRTPGLSVFEVFDRTMSDVILETNGKQNPELSISYPGANSTYIGTRPEPAPTLTQVNTAQTHFEKGRLFVDRGDWDTAILEFNEAIGLNPYYFDAYMYRGLTHLNKDDYDSAIADFTQVIRYDPNHGEAYFGRGGTFFIIKNYDRAIADFNQSIKINPDNNIAYYLRGNIYNAKSDYDAAIADYTQAIRLDPDYANVYQSRGDSYNHKEDYDTAIEDFTQAIKLNPNYALAYQGRGDSYNHKKDYDAAIEDFTQALRLDPNQANTYIGRGSAYLEKNDYDRSVADFTQAIRLDPNATIAYLGRGVAYQFKGDTTNATADLVKVLEQLTK